MKLSERMSSAIEARRDDPIPVTVYEAREWADEVAQLEAELEQRRTQIAHLQPVYLEVCAENEALRKLADSNPWYAGMLPNAYYCIHCKGSGRFTMNPKRDTRHGHKDDCPLLALLTGEQRDCHTVECTARTLAGMECICGFTGEQDA